MRLTDLTVSEQLDHAMNPYYSLVIHMLYKYDKIYVSNRG